MTTQLDDEETRSLVLRTNESFIVQAPAGSGKTGLLIQRYLALLPTVEAPEQILAMTFTRKAAGEMRQRVLGALSDAAEGRVGASPHERVTDTLARAALAHDRTHGWNLTEHPHRIQARTVDAFCAFVAAGHVFASGLGGRVEVVDDARSLFEDAVIAVLRRGSVALEVVLWHLDNDVELLREMLVDLLQRRDQWTRQIPSAEGPRKRALWREQLEATLVRETTRHLARLVELAPPTFMQRAPRLLAHAAHHLGEDLPPHSTLGADPRDRALWMRCSNLLLTKAGTARSTLTKRDGFPPDSPGDRAVKALAKEWIQELSADHPEFLDAVDAVRRLPPLRFDEGQWRVVEALITVLEELLAELQVVFRRDRVVDHSEIAARARCAIEAQPIDLRHLLVDEFQDTSTSQYRLIEALIADWTGTDGRTLFLVGDPMQSIYRFREAEVGLYLRCRSSGIGAIRPLAGRLRTNFRSSAAVVEAVNEVFQSVMPARENAELGAVPYERFSAYEAGSPADGVRVHAWLGQDDDAEAARCLDVILEARREGRGVALLGTYRHHLFPTLRRLRDAGVRYQGVELEGLAGRPVVHDLLALTSLLVSPADRLSWLTVLRGPWVGLPLEDLHAVAAGEGRLLPEILADERKLSSLSADGVYRCRRLLEAWQRAHALRQRRPLARAVESLWLTLAGPAVADPRDLEDASLLFSVLSRVESAGDLPTRSRLERRLSEFYAPLDPQADDGVQAMTIHRAKGLEFDVVLVPGLGKPRRRDDAALILWQERFGNDAAEPVRLLLAPMRSARTGERDPIYDYMAREDRVRSELEAVRLLYVACTRARSQLHLLGHLQGTAAGDWQAPADSALAALGPAVVQRCLAQATTTPLVPRALGKPLGAPRSARVRAAFDAPSALPDAGRAPAWAAASETTDALGARSPQARRARAVGVVLHRLLEAIASAGPSQGHAFEVQRHASGLRSALVGQGLTAEEAERGATEVFEGVAGMIATERGRWILSPHAGAACECEIAGVVGGQWRVGRVDRTFIADGERWVIDYKTSEVPPDVGPKRDSWIAAESRQHLAQLRLYHDLWTAVEPGRRVRTALYFVLANFWVELDPAIEPEG